MSVATTPLERIFQDIERALSYDLYYLALSVSLTIPDVCAALECDPDNIWVTGEKYIAWCEKHLEPNYAWFTGEDCYRLRCGILHPGDLLGMAVQR